MRHLKGQRAEVVRFFVLDLGASAVEKLGEAPSTLALATGRGGIFSVFINRPAGSGRNKTTALTSQFDFDVNRHTMYNYNRFQRHMF